MVSKKLILIKYQQMTKKHGQLPRMHYKDLSSILYVLSEPQSSSQTDNNVVIGVSAGIGALVLIVAVVIATVCVMLRRRYIYMF